VALVNVTRIPRILPPPPRGSISTGINARALFPRRRTIILRLELTRRAGTATRSSAIDLWRTPLRAGMISDTGSPLPSPVIVLLLQRPRDGESGEEAEEGSLLRIPALVTATRRVHSGIYTLACLPHGG
jgi:hypothetical protein